jgi:hypothetical protein
MAVTMLALWTTSALLAGCARPSAVRLEQPGLPEPQRRLDLLSEQVWWSPGGGVYRVLAEIPLPGAGTGRPTYLVYLRITTSPGEKAPQRPTEVRGFLIQTRGPQAGLARLTSAVVTGAPPAGEGRTPWDLHVHLDFEDGSHLSGRLMATREDWRLNEFETRTHTADVQALLHQPAPANEHNP